jgi:hypothetical protein
MKRLNAPKNNETITFETSGATVKPSGSWRGRNARVEAAPFVGDASVGVERKWIGHCIRDVLEIAAAVVLHQAQVGSEL